MCRRIGNLLCSFPSHSTRYSGKTIATQRFAESFGCGKLEKVYEVQLGQGGTPSILNCDIIRVTHELEVRIHNDTTCSTIQQCIPAMLGTVPFRDEAVPVPVSFDGIGGDMSMPSNLPPGIAPSAPPYVTSVAPTNVLNGNKAGYSYPESGPSSMPMPMPQAYIPNAPQQ